MTEMVQIRSVKQYFNEFIVGGLKGISKIQEIDLIRIKQQLLDAFQKEIFSQIAFKLGPEAANLSRNDLAKIDTVNNILVQSFRKWRRLCILCSENGLGNFFQLEDLRRVLEEEEDDPSETVYLPDDEGEDVTDQVNPVEISYLGKEGTET